MSTEVINNSKAVPTPSSNTGLNSQDVPTTSLEWNLTVRVDWLQGTISPAGSLQLERLVAAYEGITGDKVVWENGKGSYMGKQWENQVNSPLGFRIWFNRPGENGDESGHALISLTGGVLGRLKVEQVFDVALMLNDFGFKATRIDSALDDYSKKITFTLVRDAIEAGNYARFKKAEVIKNYGDAEYDGWTIICGSASSDRQLVIYNKHAESKGEIDSHRLEARLRDDVANQAYRDWISLPLELHPQYLAGLVVGCVEFVNRGVEKNVKRMPELDWWKEFKDAVACSIRHSIQQLTTNLRKAKKWVNHQVVKTLAIVREVVGGKAWANWLCKEVDGAPVRFNEKDRAKIAQWRYEFEEGLAQRRSAKQTS